MNISDIWELYSKSEKRVPEFDKALANLANALDVTPYEAFQGFAKIMGAGDGIFSVASLAAFPLSKRADDLVFDKAFDEAAALLEILENTDKSNPDLPVEHARATQRIKEILAGGDDASKKALHRAIQSHSDMTKGSKSSFLSSITEPKTRALLQDFSKKSADELSNIAYSKGIWRELPYKSVTEEVLSLAASGNKDAIDDVVEMSKDKIGKQLLADMGKEPLEKKLVQIAQRAKASGVTIPVADIMKQHALDVRFAEGALARLKEPKRITNIIADMFGRGRPMSERLRAAWRATGEMASLAKHWKPLAAILGLAAAGAGAFHIFKTLGFGGGKDTPPGSSGASASGAGADSAASTGATSGTTPDAASGVSPDIIAGGDIADRVRTRLKQVYSGGKK